MIKGVSHLPLHRNLLQGIRRFASKYNFEKDIPKDAQKKKMNLYQAVNDAMDIVLATDKTYIRTKVVPKSLEKM